MLLKSVAIFAIWTALAVVHADEQPKFGGSFEPTNRDYLSSFGEQNQQQQQQQQMQQFQQQQDNNGYNATSVDAVIDTILATGREGRNLDGFDEVYSDPSVQDALTKSDDRQARNIIKDKLCSLGLMDCDNSVQIEGKRPFLPPGELIYSQPPPGYHQSGAPLQQQRPPQQRPPPGAYGPARPMPPPQPQGNKYNGPPRKVGYVGSPYPGGNNNFQSRPPGQSAGSFYEGSSPIYGSQGNGGNTVQRPFDGQIFEGPKPPGPIYEDNSSPYKFDTSSSQIHEQHDKFETIEYPAQKIVAQPAGAAGGSTVNIHHHYHHLDGAADTKTIAVNPVTATQGAASFGSSSSLNSLNSFNGLSASSEFSGLTAGGFSPMNSIGGGSSSGSSGYFNKQQQHTGLGSYGSGHSTSAYKPVIEQSNSLIGVSGPGSYDGATNSYGGIINSGSTYGTGSFNGQQQNHQSQQFGTSGSGGLYSQNPQQSFHSQNPDFHKKALNTNSNGNGGAAANSLSSLSQYSKYNTQFNTGENYQGFETARQETIGDCVCVPYEQCPSQDVIGRKDDLILPLDPRNLKTDIEAAADEMILEKSANVTTAEKRVDDKKTTEEEKKVDSEQPKKIVKREAEAKAEKKSIQAEDEALDQADGQARHFGGIGGVGGLGGGYGGGGYGVGGFGNPLGGKKVVPTFGVSFGLPYPTNAGYGGYPINPFGGAPAVNQNFGALSPNGLNLGLVNVNPLVSFQVAKNELGEKLFKPLVNLHVTPNANIIQKVGDLWKAKKFGFGGGPQINQHYHTHQHYPQPPEVYHPHHESGPYLEHPPHHYESAHPPHHYEGPPQHHYEGPPHHHHEGPPQHYGGPPSGPGGYPSGPSGYPSGPGGYSPSGPGGFSPSGPGGYGFSGPQQGYYRDGSAQDDAQYDGQSIPNLSEYEQYQQNQQQSYDHYSGRSSADNTTTQQQQFQQASYQDVFPQNKQLQASGDSIGPGAYADYASYNQQQPQQQQTQQQQQQQQQLQQPQSGNNGKQSVAFPNSRRKRSTDSVEDSSKPVLEARSTGVESSSVEKRQAFYQQQQQRPQQQCSAQQVCCRRPYRPQQQQQQVPSFQPGQCGRRNTNGITGRIKNPSYIDGDSEFGEYPWQVAILKKDPKESVYICGGTLIDAQHILTAAHCVRTYTNYDLRIRLGEWDVNHDVEFFPYIERDAVSVTVHPEYYAGTLDNDLAIIRLNAPVDFAGAPHISPACLPDKFTDYTGARCWTTGWGKDAFGDFGKYQNILKEVDVPVIGQQQCQQQLRSTRLGYSYKLNPGFICAGGEEGKDACKGDGGGPMVCERNGSWQLVGIVSWGIGCGQVNVPGVYVRVAHYLDWIQANTRRF